MKKKVFATVLAGMMALSLTACGNADAPILQDIDGVLGGHAGDGNGENVGRFMSAGNLHARQGRQGGHQMVFQ